MLISIYTLSPNLQIPRLETRTIQEKWGGMRSNFGCKWDILYLQNIFKCKFILLFLIEDTIRKSQRIFNLDLVLKEF